jgi:hypothetical protein
VWRWGLDSGEFGHMRDMIADRVGLSARHCLCQVEMVLDRKGGDSGCGGNEMG